MNNGKKAGIAVFAAVLFFGLKIGEDQTTMAERLMGHQPEKVKAHWSYAGQEGPEHWGQLDSAYGTCSKGQAQSPVNLPALSAYSTASGAGVQLEAMYKPVALDIMDNGHTIQVSTPEAGHIEVDGAKYNLLQFHFHSPSENAVDGQLAQMEMHMVHANEKGQLAVVGVLINEGAENKALADFWGAIPAKKQSHKDGSVKVDPARLLPEERSFYSFKGSLTTPPCSEGVTWMVMAQPVTASAEQIAKYVARHPHSNRPLQALHGRQVALNRGNASFIPSSGEGLAAQAEPVHAAPDTAPVKEVAHGTAHAAPVAVAHAAPKPAHKKDTHHWGYEGALGPMSWGNLGFPACSAGKSQSPVDIARLDAGHASKGLVFDYGSSAVSVVNNGHTVKFNVASGSRLTVTNEKSAPKTFELLQFHFHGRSEHTVSGEGYPVEMHLVHKAEDGTLAVVGVFFKASDVADAPVNNAVQTVFGALPGKAKMTLSGDDVIDMASMLPSQHTFYHYMGSLTTPPCTEGVNWFVMTEATPIAQALLDRYLSIYNKNYRPVQGLHGRPMHMGGGH